MGSEPLKEGCGGGRRTPGHEGPVRFDEGRVVLAMGTGEAVEAMSERT